MQFKNHTESCFVRHFRRLCGAIPGCVDSFLYLSSVWRQENPHFFCFRVQTTQNASIWKDVWIHTFQPLKEVRDVDDMAKAKVKAESIDDYKNLFVTHELPPVAEYWDDDRNFAWLRVSGPNPTSLTQATEIPDHFPVTATLALPP